MSTSAIPTPQFTPPAKFDNAQEWWHALGDVPLERIVMDPWPGTATEKDLLKFVERDKRLVELIDGTLVEKSVGFEEDQIAINIAAALHKFVKPRRLGMVGGAQATIRMVGGRIRLPDAVFISYDDVPGGKSPGVPVPQIPPTLAVEVLSASNTPGEMKQKIREYFASGSRLVWLADPPTKTIAIYTEASEKPSRVLSSNETPDGGTVLPGFSVSVAELFDI